MCHVEKTEINKERGRDWPIQKTTILSIVTAWRLSTCLSSPTLANFGSSE